MSETKITTNLIEKALLNKKRAEVVEEVATAAYNLAYALNTFSPHSNNAVVPKEEMDAFKTWVTSFFEVSHRVFVNEERINRLPEYVEKNLLQTAVDEFIRSVEQTKTVLESIDS